MLSLDRLENVISLLDEIRDDVKKNYPDLEEKEWFQKLETVLNYFQKINSALSVFRF